MLTTSPETRRDRSLVERLMIRFPGIARRISRLVLGLPQSRARDRVIRHFVALVYQAFNRRDWEVNMAFFDPDRYEFRTGEIAKMIPGTRELYCGREGYMEAMEAWLEVWSDIRIRLDDVFQIGPNRFVTLIHFIGTGMESGIQLHQEVATAFDLRDGAIVAQTYWWERGTAARELGLDLAAMSRS